MTGNEGGEFADDHEIIFFGVLVMMAALLMPATGAEPGDLLVDVEDVVIAARAYDNGNY